MNKANNTDKRLRQSILDVLAYGAVRKKSLTDQEILTFMPVKASIVGVRSHLVKLKDRGKIQQLKNGTYGLKKITYPKKVVSEHEAEFVKRARFWSRIFRLLPFVHAIVLVQPTVAELKNAVPDVNLIFITSPNRIYVTKGVLYHLLNLFGLRRGSGTKDGCFYLNQFYTTRGVRFVNDIAKPELLRSMWFATGRPLYGKDTWEDLLRKDPFLHKNLPNYSWKPYKIRIVSPFSRLLDGLDDSGYRRHLQHVARQPEYRQTGALLRIRPDALIQLPRQGQQMTELEKEYSEIRKTVL